MFYYKREIVHSLLREKKLFFANKFRTEDQKQILFYDTLCSLVFEQCINVPKRESDHS